MKKLFNMILCATALFSAVACSNTVAPELGVEDIHAPRLVAAKGDIELFYAPFVFNDEEGDWEYQSQRFTVSNYQFETMTFEYDTVVPKKSNYYISKSPVINGVVYIPHQLGDHLEFFTIKELGISFRNPRFENEELLSKISLEEKNSLDEGEFGVYLKEYISYSKIYLLDNDDNVVGMASNYNSRYYGYYIGNPTKVVINKFRNNSLTQLCGEYVYNI